ncbi:MAG: tyrosine-type recombinase/integrase, partial [Nanoarchaeota archaeon]
MSDEIAVINNNNLQHKPDDDFNADILIEQFLADTQNILENTKKRYKKSLKLYFEWVKRSQYQLKNITLTELLIYKAELENKVTKEGGKLSPFTVSTYLIAVKEFYKWANGKGLMYDPAKALKSPKKEHRFRRKPLNEEQIKLLFDYFKSNSKRDYALINVMYYCGLRTIEISRLDIGDIEIIDGVRQVAIQGKGKITKDRWVKLLDKAFVPLSEYLATREELKPSDPIFVSESITEPGGRLIAGTISKIVKRGLRAIGLNERMYTAHGIRHSAATNAIKKGASISQVQEMLRHADEKTTLNYIYT